MKVVSYVRVSTDGQAQDGFGLDVQRHDIEAWAKREGHEIVEWFADEGVSGSNGIADRTALPKALAAIEDGRAKGLVAHRLDRLARSLGVQEAILAHVWQAGGSVFTVDDGEVAEDGPGVDPVVVAMRQMRGVFAQLDRAMIRERLRAGVQAKKRRGGYYSGRPPYGWRSSGDGFLEPVDAEQKVIVRIVKLREAGEAPASIAAYLNAQGVPTKVPGGRWHENSVRRVLGRVDVPPQGVKDLDALGDPDLSDEEAMARAFPGGKRGRPRDVTPSA